MQSHRWALLGNAVSVPVAGWIGERLAHPHRHKYMIGSKDRKFITDRAPAPQGETPMLNKICHAWNRGRHADLCPLHVQIVVSTPIAHSQFDMS